MSPRLRNCSGKHSSDGWPSTIEKFHPCWSKLVIWLIRHGWFSRLIWLWVISNHLQTKDSSSHPNKGIDRQPFHWWLAALFQSWVEWLDYFTIWMMCSKTSNQLQIALLKDFLWHSDDMLVGPPCAAQMQWTRFSSSWLMVSTVNQPSLDGVHACFEW